MPNLLVLNSSFESDTSGWTANVTSTLTRTTGQGGQSGTACGTITIVTAGAACAYTTSTGSPTITPGEVYSASAYFRWRGGTPRNCRVDIRWLDAGNTAISTNQGTATMTTSGWTRIVIDGITAPGNAVKASVRLNTAAGSVVGEIIDIDAVQLELSATSTAYSDDSAPPPASGLPLAYTLSDLSPTGSPAITTNTAGTGDRSPDVIAGTAPTIFSDSTLGWGRSPIVKYSQVAATASYLRWNFTATSLLASKLRIYLSGVQASGTGGIYTVISSSGGTVLWRLSVRSDGNASIVGNGGTTLTTSSAAIPLKQWLHIETEYDGTSGAVTVRFYKFSNRTLVFTMTTTAGTGSANQVWLGANSTTVTLPTFYADDLEVVSAADAPSWSEPFDGRQQALVMVNGVQRNARLAYWVKNNVNRKIVSSTTPAYIPTPDPANALYPSTPGHALFGVYIVGGDLNTFEAMEAEAGQHFAISKGYYTFGDTAVPKAQHVQHSVDGRRIHIALATRYSTSYDSGLLPTPGDAVNKVWKYTQISNGSCDAYLGWLANQLKLLPSKFSFDLNVEPENQSQTFRKTCFSDPAWYDNRNSNTLSYTRGVLKEYADAYRYVRSYLINAGVTNAIWTMTWGGLGATGSWHNTNVYPSIYPGDDAIDVVAWDPYVNDPSLQTALSKWSTGYNYLNNGGLDGAFFYSGIGAKNKPYQLSEYGTRMVAADGSADTTRINWLNQIPSALAALPKIKAIQYFSSTDTNVDPVHTNPATRVAFNQLSLNPIFEQPSS